MVERGQKDLRHLEPENASRRDAKDANVARDCLYTFTHAMARMSVTIGATVARCFNAEANSGHMTILLDRARMIGPVGLV